MPNPRCVVIYGNTLALAGLAIALEYYAELKVVMLDAERANRASQLAIYAPDVIIFDQGQTDAQAVLAYLEQHHQVLVIGIDANTDQMFIWSGQSARALTTQDLVHAINSSGGTSNSWSSEFDRVHQSIATRLGGLSQIRPVTRNQKLGFAVAMIGLCLVVLVGIAEMLTPTNMLLPLTGATVGSQMQLEIWLAFVCGMALGGLLTWLWFRQSRKHSNFDS